MPQANLESIVQRMIDAGESEENIATVVRGYKSAPQPDKEAEFQSWYKDRSSKFGLSPDPDDPKHFYDYRAAHAAGAEPSSEDGHWPSEFKREGHPNLVVDGVDTRNGRPVEQTGRKSGYRDWIAAGIRGASGFAPPFLPGAIIGGGAEILAQTIEDRDSYNLPQIGTQAALGAVPFGKVSSIGRSMMKGAAMGGVGGAATHIAETGELPDVRDLVLPTALGSVGGGVAGGLSKWAKSRAVPKIGEAIASGSSHAGDIDLPLRTPEVPSARPAGPWDNNPDLTAKPAVLNEDAIFENASKKLNMGRPMPDEERVLSGPIREVQDTADDLSDRESILRNADYVTDVEGLSRDEARFQRFLTASNQFPDEVFRTLATLAKRYREFGAGTPEAGQAAREMIIIRDFMESGEPIVKSPTAPDPNLKTVTLGAQPVTPPAPTAPVSPLQQQANTITGGNPQPPAPVTPLQQQANQILASAVPPVASSSPSGNVPPRVPPNRPPGGGGAGTTPPSNRPPRPPRPPRQPSPGSIPIIRKFHDPTIKESGIFWKAWDTAKGMMSVDLPFITSAAFRQALPMVGTKNWYNAWMPSVRSFGSKAAFDTHIQMLRADPLSQRVPKPVLNRAGQPLVNKQGQAVLKEQASVLDRMGITLSDTRKLSRREEAIQSGFAEQIPIIGKYIKASNRSYTAFINDIRMSMARNMYAAMPDKNNEVELKQIGNLINTLTGKGPLKVEIPKSTTMFGKQVTLPTYKLGEHKAIGGGTTPIDLERYANVLNKGIFAPKLIAARMQMLNPVNYIMTQPNVRKEYIKAAARTAGAWLSVAGAASITGAGEVSLDPRSADFGKVRVGDLRLDPAGGFQQFLVLLARESSGESVSSTNPNQVNRLGSPRGELSPTYESVLGNFIKNKLHPRLRQMIDAGGATKGKPYHVIERELEMWLPLITKDMIEVAEEEPELLPFLAPFVSAGMGAQYYEQNEDFNKPTLTPLLGLDDNEITLGQPQRGF